MPAKYVNTINPHDLIFKGPIYLDFNLMY